MIDTFSPRATRARAADWVELRVAAGDRKVTRADLRGSQDILEEDPRDSDDLDMFDASHGIDLGGSDGEITDQASEGLAEAVYEELVYRQKVLGTLYPYELVESFNSWHLKRRRATNRAQTMAHICYIACLVMTSARSELLKNHLTREQLGDIADAFQAIAYINSAEIVGGSAYWMGWPRPDRTLMLHAVQEVVKKMHLGTAVKRRPASVNNMVKDGGIDIVAWRNFLDGRPPGLVMYGQVASGEDWQGKPISGNLRKFRPFFVRHPSERPIHALFMPRVAHDKIAEDSEYSFEQSAQEHAYELEGDMGLIVDRLRLTELASEYARSGKYPRGEFERCVTLALRWTSAALKSARNSEPRIDD